MGNPANSFSVRRAWRWAAVFACGAASFSCGRNKQIIEIDPRFSMNVVQVPSWYPGEEEAITPIQREVIRLMGQPDYIRFWWNRDGTFITSSDLAGKGEKIPDMFQEIKRTWVYLARDKEVEFKPDGSYVEHPLTEQLKLLCRYGDPNQKSAPKRMEAGSMRETWIWVEHGLKIEFVDGAEVRRSNFAATGAGTVLK